MSFCPRRSWQFCNGAPDGRVFSMATAHKWGLCDAAQAIAYVGCWMDEGSLSSFGDVGGRLGFEVLGCEGVGVV